MSFEREYPIVALKSNNNIKCDRELFAVYKDGKIIGSEGTVLMDSFLCPNASKPSGMMGLEFDINFECNGLFYVNYYKTSNCIYTPPEDVNPSKQSSLCQTWKDDSQYSSLNILEEWKYSCSGSKFQRKIIIIKNPFIGNNGSDTLGWSYDTDSLIMATGDGGYRFDPYNLASDDNRPHGKVISIDSESRIEWETPKPISSMHQLNSSQKKIIEIISKGIMRPSGISNYSKKSLLCDKGPSTGKVYHINKGDNYGWRSNDGVAPTMSKYTNVDKSGCKCEEYKEEKKKVVCWNINYQTHHTLLVAPGDKIHFYSDDKRVNDIIQLDKSHKPLLRQKYFTSPSDKIDEHMEFEEEGKYYIGSNYSSKVLVVIVTYDVANERKHLHDMHELHKERLCCPSSSYTYLTMFRQEFYNNTDTTQPITYTISDNIVEGGNYSKGSNITGALNVGGNLYISTLNTEDEDGKATCNGYLEKNGNRIDGPKGLYTCLGLHESNPYLAYFDGTSHVEKIAF